MAIKFLCPCGKTLRTADENARRRVRCSQCHAILVVPEPDFVPFEDEGEPDPRPAPPPPARPGPGPEPGPRPVRMRFGESASAPPAPPEPEYDPDEYALGPPDAAPAPWLVPDRGEREPSVYQPVRGTSSPSSSARGPSSPTRPTPRFDPEGDDRGSSIREYLHWVLIFALLPLALSILVHKDDIKERLARSLKVPVERLEAELENVSKEDLFARLPGRRVEGALLAQDSAVHWAFAGMSASAFLCLLLLMFPRGDARPLHLVAVGAFTATVGILFLLLVQFASALTGGGRIWVGKAAVVWLILRLIRFSYEAATDDRYGFIPSALGFTFGVGLCEELCKAIPFLWIYHRSGGATWRQACLWGLASGIGFGVSEGIMYSGDKYNGLATGLTYLVRFISCVALHAIWGASVGLTLDRRQDTIRGTEGFAYAWALLRIIAVPMVLHGLYDTLLKKDMELAALGVAITSFFWFAWLVESARAEEDAGQTSRAWS